MRLVPTHARCAHQPLVVRFQYVALQEASPTSTHLDLDALVASGAWGHRMQEVVEKLEKWAKDARTTVEDVACFGHS